MQSRDEIAEQVVALAGSVSNEKAAKMRELVSEARIEGVDRILDVVDALRRSHMEEVKRLDELTVRVSKAETTIKAAWDNDAKGHAWNEERISALERGRLAAPFGQIPQHAFERAPENTVEGASKTTDMDEIRRERFDELREMRAPRPAPPPSVEAVRALVEAADAMLEEPEGDSPKPTWVLIDDYEKARAALFALPESEAPPGVLPQSKTLNECREVFRRVAKRGPCLSSPDLHGIAAVRDFLTLDEEAFRRNWGNAADAASEAQGEPTLEECKTAFLTAWEKSRGPHAKACFWNKDEQAGLAAVRSLCLASRAPSIEDVVDALLRVTSYKSSYETGASGLVCRADVEQVMRALFDRSGK